LTDHQTSHLLEIVLDVTSLSACLSDQWRFVEEVVGPECSRVKAVQRAKVDEAVLKEDVIAA
jgi:hypothetical protein